MELERVSFKVAKAIKEAGYPTFNMTDESYPTYLSVWLWIEQETDILIDSECIRSDTFVGYRYMAQYPSGSVYPKYKIECSPYCYKTREEAIIAAIEYLVSQTKLEKITFK